MLNRNKLVSQFELVIQQEIKNHNDALLSYHISVANLKEVIKEHQDTSEKARASIESKAGTLESKIENLQISFKDLEKKLSGILRHRNILDDQFESKDADLKLKQELHHQELNKLKNDVYEINLFNAKSKELILKNAENLQQHHERVEIKLKDGLSKLKQEILSSPTDLPEIKKELEQKLEIAYVDFQAVMKELEAIKISSFFQEKKIENIYTLIDRLEKKVTS